MTKTSKILRKTLRIFLWILAGILGLILLVIIFINLPVGKRVIRNQAVSYLENKLNTKVSIGEIDFSLPKWVELKNVYIEDQKKDTLVYGGKLAVDVAMLKLISGDIDIKKVAVSDLTVKLNRSEKDSFFNYQFIINAFASPTATPAAKDTSAMQLTLDEVSLKNIRFVSNDAYGGTDMYAYVGALSLTTKTFQPDRMKFFFDELRAKQVVFTMDTYKAAGVIDTVKMVDTSSDNIEYGLFVTANKLLLENALVRVDNKINGLHYDNKLNHFEVNKIRFNMDESEGSADQIFLDSSSIGFVSPTVPVVVMKKDTVITETVTPWNFSVNKLLIAQTAIKYDDSNKPAADGLDFGHMDIANLFADVNDFKYAPDVTKASVTQLAFADKSGFKLDTTHAVFSMTDKELNADDIYIKTPNSLITRSVSLTYDSLAGITLNPKNTTLTAVLENSRVAFKDIYLLVPALKASLPPAQFANQYVDVNTKLQGSLARLNLPYFQLVGLTGSRINAKGVLFNLTDPDKFAYNLEIINSSFLKQDLVKFIPPEQLAQFASLPPVINLKGTFVGDMNALTANINTSAKDFGLSGIFKISNIKDPANIKFDANVSNLALTKGLIEGFLPPEAKAQINLPERLSAKGKLAGNTNNITTDLKVFSSYGDATVKGFINNIQDPTKAKYDLAFSTPGFNVGKLIRQDTTIGVLAGNFAATGTGFDYKTMNSDIKANISSFGFNKYDYKDVKVQAQLNNGYIQAKGISQDPNLALAFNLNANVKNEFPSVNGTIRIDTVQLQNLNLYDSVLNFSGLVKVDAKNLKPRQLDASLLIDTLRLRMGSQRFVLDTISVVASNQNGVDSIKFRAPFATINAGGAFDYDKIGISLQRYINKYYTLPVDSSSTEVIAPQQLGFEGTIKQTPILTALVPGLTAFSDISFDGEFNSDEADSALALHANIPMLQYSTYKISEGKIGIQSTSEKINYDLTFDTLDTGSKLLYGTFVRGAAANDSLSLNARTQDNTKRDWFGIAGTASVANEDYSFRLQDSLILNYETWEVARDNYISYNKDGIIVNHVVLNNDTSSISIASKELVRNSPIDINVKDFDLETISSIASGDTLLASGVLNIQATVSDLDKPLPGFTGNATATNLQFLQNHLGDLTANAEKVNDNEIAADLSLQGYGNDVKANGNYYLNNSNKEFDAKLNINSFSFRTIEAFSAGQLTNSSGRLRGDFTATGKFADPRWKGEVNFDTTKFTITQLGTPYFIDQQKIVLDYPRVSFPKFTIKDSLDHNLIFDGYVATTPDMDLRLNLDINAKDFVLVNAKRAVGSQLYGYAAVDADIKITGTGVAPKIEGNVLVNDKSDLTILLPETNYAKTEGEGIVRFIDRDTFDINPPVVAFKPAADPPKTFAQFLNYNLNIQVNKEAAFTIVIDPITGDEVKVQGDARLNAGVDPGGNLILAGNYNLFSGYYDFHYQFLTRKFDLVQGSTIAFAGEPMDAVVDITASYTANTSAKELIGNEVSNADASTNNALNQKLPFNVLLHLTGPLSKPNISFDISLPDEGVNINSSVRSSIDGKLAQIRDDEAATNKQVFSLLLFGRFVGEQSSDFFKGNGGGGFSDIARQSVSQFLSEALNQIAGDVIKGVDIDLGLNAYNDYSSGNAANRTDLNVAVSKSFLNDRLKVSVGQSFGLEGQDAASKAAAGNTGFKPDISLGYKLTKDGKYLLRAYTKNQYEATVDGFVVETGLSFVVTLDYDKFRELFQKNKKK